MEHIQGYFFTGQKFFSLEVPKHIINAKKIYPREIKLFVILFSGSFIASLALILSWKFPENGTQKSSPQYRHLLQSNTVAFCSGIWSREEHQHTQAKYSILMWPQIRNQNDLWFQQDGASPHMPVRNWLDASFNGRVRGMHHALPHDLSCIDFWF